MTPHPTAVQWSAVTLPRLQTHSLEVAHALRRFPHASQVIRSAYLDGSCLANRQAGAGGLFVARDTVPAVRSACCIGHADSFVAELAAMWIGVTAACTAGLRNVRLYADHLGLVNALRYDHKVRAGFEDTVRQLRSDIRHSGLLVLYIEAHRGHRLHNQADRLASLAAHGRREVR